MTSNRAPFAPTVYRIPQLTSDARRMAREATLREERQLNPIIVETPSDGLEPLPAHSPKPPKSQLFSMPKQARLALAKLTVRSNKAKSKLLDPKRLRSANAYAKLFRSFSWPDDAYRIWNDDRWFAAQRLRGANPMQIERVTSWPPDWTGCPDLAQLEAVATAELLDIPRNTSARGRPGARIETLAKAAWMGRLFATRHHHIVSPFVTTNVAKAALAAPTTLYLLDDDEQLKPLAIQLRPPDLARWPHNPAFRPHSSRQGELRKDWQLARAHVQAADAHYHQGVFHLLETHLVNEALGICISRELHPHHPLRQLLTPHYQGTLAINDVARKNLLTPGGPIDSVMCAGVDAVMNLGRLWYANDWNWKQRSLRCDLQTRGVSDLPGYRYAEDGLRLTGAIENYVRGVLSPWYSAAAPDQIPDRDRDVRDDAELQGFLRAAADPQYGNVRGFPSSANCFADLVELVAEMIFRAGPQHAAVNNGQFDTYGWVPNGPGTVYADLPTTDEGFAVHDFFSAMPDRDACHAQLGMVWVLSDPTESTILRSGESPAFTPESCFESAEAVAQFRRELRAIQETQDRLNRQTRYLYLMPENVSRSTDM